MKNEEKTTNESYSKLLTYAHIQSAFGLHVFVMQSVKSEGFHAYSSLNL